MPDEADRANDLSLRDLKKSAPSVFFEYQLDAEANRMAAFIARVPADRMAFDAHWEKIMADDTVTIRTILYGQQIAGHVASFVMEGNLEVTYWIGREFWGKGIATRALAEFLKLVETRPIYGVAALDNTGSIRVLEKCGFKEVGRKKAYASARQAEIEEVTLELR